MDFPIQNRVDQAETEVQHEAAVWLAGERRTGDDAIDLELEARFLDRLLQQHQQFAEGPGELVGVEAHLAGRAGEVTTGRLNLALEDRLESKRRVCTVPNSPACRADFT